MTKIKKTHVEELYDGDKITVAVTHEVKIDRESAWVRYEASSLKQEIEDTEDAKRRVIGHVTRSVMDTVYATAEAVAEAKEH